MQKSKTETLIQKYLSHQLNEQEFEELKQWIEEDASHREIFVKLLSLRHVNNQLNLLRQFDKEVSWEAIQKRCKRTRSIRRRIAIYSSAAAIAVIIGISSILYFYTRQESSSLTAEKDITKTERYNTVFSPRATLVLADQSEVKLYSNQQEINGSHINNGEIIYPQEDNKEANPTLDTKLLQNQLKVPRGSEYSIVLSDGTKVKLNADSHLDFPVQFTNIREVTLQGEAFFDVTHDPQRPFIVKANEHTIYVLGTTFNVTAYPGEDVSITLVTGKIKVATPTGEYVMAPNEHYSSHISSITQVDPELYTSWTTGAMEFDAMPLPDLLARLSRCYNVDLKLASKELESMKFTGIIFRNKPLSFALDILHRVSDVKFEKDGETILVKKQ
ncbi:FecR family protein [Phocaeicola sp.]